MPKYGPNYLSRSNVGDDSTSSSIVAVGADFRNHCGGCLPSSAFPWRLSSHPSPPKYSYGAYMEHCKLPKSQACPEAGVWPKVRLRPAGNMYWPRRRRRLSSWVQTGASMPTLCYHFTILLTCYDFSYTIILRLPVPCYCALKSCLDFAEIYLVKI